MSFVRRGKWGPNGIGPTGKKLCYCGCGQEISKGARSTATAQCYPKWALINDQTTIRRAVFERDKGICAVCRVDSRKKQREAQDTKELMMWLARRHAQDILRAGGKLELNGMPFDYGDWAWACRIVEQWVKERFGVLSGHAWEADHIIPVIEGGGQCDLTGYRTLCIACHKQATKDLAARRAKAHGCRGDIGRAMEKGRRDRKGRAFHREDQQRPPRDAARARTDQERHRARVGRATD